MRTAPKVTFAPLDYISAPYQRWLGLGGICEPEPGAHPLGPYQTRMRTRKRGDLLRQRAAQPAHRPPPRGALCLWGLCAGDEAFNRYACNMASLLGGDLAVLFMVAAYTRSCRARDPADIRESMRESSVLMADADADIDDEARAAPPTPPTPLRAT